ncbi:MAG: leucine-rich repeat domain-containing protein, partial [Candidatus Lokiarchaeota archaeon]|nr:leucine-rich repeat domain-containing protein [Candidatus Lokiarchaeota archaeon]
MELHPNFIRENLDQIGRKEGLALLREWIDNSSNPILRQAALKNFSLIEQGKNFKFFEQLFLSDEDLNMRIIAGEILKEKYSNNKKLIILLEYTLKKVDNVELKLFAVKTLNSISNMRARIILIDFLKDIVKKEFKDKTNKFQKEIYTLNHKSTIPESFLEVCINLILNEYYTNECGYHVTLRKGKIISINCESSQINSISEIIQLISLNNLEHLYLQRNNLRKIDGFYFLKNLRTLDLSYN